MMICWWSMIFTDPMTCFNYVTATANYNISFTQSIGFELQFNICSRWLPHLSGQEWKMKTTGMQLCKNYLSAMSEWGVICKNVRQIK